MALVQADMGNPVHGVSRQPDERKFKGQCREQINARSNLAKGLDSRAGFAYIGELLPESGDLSKAKWVSQERGDGTTFITAYTSTRPEIFALNAIRQTFVFGNGANGYYLAASDTLDPSKRFGISSILDTTFITNRGVVPLGDDANDKIESFPKVAWIQFKTFTPGTEIKMSSPNWDTLAGGGTAETSYFWPVFDGFVTVSSGTPVEPNRGESKRTREYDGAFHAKVFVEGVPPAPTPPPVDPFNATEPEIPEEALSPEVGTYFNNWVRVEGQAAESIHIEGGGESIEIFYSNDLDAIEKLPPVAHAGDRCRIIEGQGEDRNTGYFIAVHKDLGLAPDALGEVTWKETTAGGSSGVLDATTMPYRILREPNPPFVDVFTMDTNDWTDREIGDSDSSPYPSFILDKTPIQSIGIFQNRLFMTASETVSLSRSDSYYDLWASSAFYNTDADPFEVYADTDELNIIKYAEQFDGDLIFFSENGQFIISGKETHTYKTAFIQAASQYRSDLTADPVLSGDNIFFAIDYGNFAGVRELYTDNLEGTKRSRPITEHVEDYMPGNIRHMTTSTNIDAVVCLTDELNAAYVYEFRWKLSDKVQSSWSKWEFSENTQVLWMGFIKSSLYAVVNHRGRYLLWQLEWDDQPTSHGLDFAVKLDGRFEVTEIEYDEDTGLSSWNVLFTGYDDENLVFVKGPESTTPGFKVIAEKGVGGVWTAKGDLRGVTLICGLTYETSITFASPLVRDQDGVAQNFDRLQVNGLHLKMQTVGEVYFDISDDRDRKRTLKFNNRRMNTLNNRMSYINTSEAYWDIPVRKKTAGLELRLYSSDVTPFTLKSIEWKGEYNQRGRRIS